MIDNTMLNEGEILVATYTAPNNMEVAAFYRVAAVGQRRITLIRQRDSIQYATDKRHGTSLPNGDGTEGPVVLRYNGRGSVKVHELATAWRWDGKPVSIRI